MALQIGQVEGENVEEVKKQKAIKGLLNKITPEKFEKILGDIIAVGYETEETESGLIDQVRLWGGTYTTPSHVLFRPYIQGWPCSLPSHTCMYVS